MKLTTNLCSHSFPDEIEFIPDLVKKNFRDNKLTLYFNNISDKINLVPMYTTDFCMEIDDRDDLLEAEKYYKKNGLNK